MGELAPFPVGSIPMAAPPPPVSRAVLISRANEGEDHAIIVHDARPDQGDRTMTPRSSSASAAPTTGGRPRGGWILAATILGSSLSFIDGTVVNVALPALQAGLGASVSQVQWV